MKSKSKPRASLLLIGAAAAALLSSGCASGHSQHYRPYCDPQQLTGVSLLQKDSKPDLYQVAFEEIDLAAANLRAVGYYPIGESFFNDRYESVENARRQAYKLRANALVTGSKFSHTVTSSSAIPIPTSQTTYHSGTMMAGHSFNPSYGNRRYTGNSFGTYSGSSTTYGTTYIPITKTTHMYYQRAIYFVKKQ